MRMAGGRDLVFVTCMVPQDYMTKTTVPECFAIGTKRGGPGEPEEPSPWLSEKSVEISPRFCYNISVYLCSRAGVKNPRWQAYT